MVTKHKVMYVEESLHFTADQLKIAEEQVEKAARTLHIMEGVTAHSLNNGRAITIIVEGRSQKIVDDLKMTVMATLLHKDAHEGNVMAGLFPGKDSQIQAEDSAVLDFLSS